MPTAQGRIRRGRSTPGRSRTNDQIFKADQYKPLIVAYHNGARCGWATWQTCRTRWKTSAMPGWPNGKPAVLIIVFRQPGANIIDTVDRVQRCIAAAAGFHSRRPSI